MYSTWHRSHMECYIQFWALPKTLELILRWFDQEELKKKKTPKNRKTRPCEKQLKEPVSTGCKRRRGLQHSPPNTCRTLSTHIPLFLWPSTGTSCTKVTIQITKFNGWFSISSSPLICIQSCWLSPYLWDTFVAGFRSTAVSQLPPPSVVSVCCLLSASPPFHNFYKCNVPGSITCLFFPQLPRLAP